MTVSNPGAGAADRMAGLVAPYHPALLPFAFTAPGANIVWACRVVVPKAGTLHDVTIGIGNSAGNVRCAVYDTGDALAGSRTRLWDSGSVAAGAGNTFQVVGDPAIAVASGQNLDLAVVGDNGALTLARTQLPIPIGLPTGFWPAAGGALPKLGWSQASAAPNATVLEAAAIANTSFMFFLMARVA